jgi:aldehyde dehydrogenase (NAD+)
MSDYESMLNKQRAFFLSGQTKELSFRIESLKKLKSAIQANEDKIAEALQADLGKSQCEAYATETGFVLSELGHTIKHLRSWARIRSVPAPMVHFPSSTFIMPEPYGVALIMSPWNYPFQLTIAPLIGSIAAGNCTVIKPSAYSPHTSALVARIMKENFDEGFVAVQEGGRDVNKALLDEKFDYIFFTGSVAVGKTVMAAASRHLTPVTLELGGKSPCIVDESANIDLAARRIAWGKFINAGQTCVAPDYLLAHKKVKAELLAALKKYIAEFYGKEPLANAELCRIINDKHVQRLKGLMGKGQIVAGGEIDEASGKIAPTVIDGISWDDPVMQEEIFGPVLPVIEFEDLEDAIKTIVSLPKPLALYCFTTDKRNERRVLNAVSFGGGCINDTIVHLASSHMPFSGVGNSGMGGYHGKYSFDTFSHLKSVLKKSNALDIALRYPPYKGKLKMIKMVMK